jgi:hypothetical protein
MSIPPGPLPPWHQRYWGYYNRPYPGCGCFITVVVILFIWWIIAMASGGARWGG